MGQQYLAILDFYVEVPEAIIERHPKTVRGNRGSIMICQYPLKVLPGLTVPIISLESILPLV